MDIQLHIDYQQFLQEVLTKIQSARYDMLRSVGRGTVLLYWEIGKDVSENYETKSWGQFVVKQLASDIQKEFPGVLGFSARNIWLMKRFYEYYNNIFQLIENKIENENLHIASLRGHYEK